MTAIQISMALTIGSLLLGVGAWVLAVLIASVALTVITIVLNAAAVVKVKRKEANHS